MTLSDIIRNREVNTIKAEGITQFGDSHDGVIEFVGVVDGGLVEVGYYYGDIKPKNIIVVSTQVGCPSKCNFCELGSEKFVRNLTVREIFDQSVLILKRAENCGLDINTRKHKVNFAKSGDPLFNHYFTEALVKTSELGFSFKVSTIFPSGSKAREIFDGVADFASKYSEPVQIQISLISTSEEYRKDAAGIKVASFEDISAAAEHWKDRNPDGRKINLSLILNEDTPANVEDIKSILTPELFRVRLRPCVSTDNGKAHGLKTISNIRYAVIKDQFRQAGYEVGDWAIPTETEQRHGLASNVTLHRYKQHKNQF